MRPAATLATVLALHLGGCQGLPFDPFAPSFPPDRAAWDDAPLAVRSAHARALQTALMRPERDPVPWSAAGASGTITLANTKEVGPTICRGFTDRIAMTGGQTEVRDVACWGDGWFYLRDPDGVPVIEPAFEEEDRVYVVQSGGSMAAVARRTGADLAALQALNPAYPERLPAGTRVLLP
jgi:hypothetical protein